MEKRKDHYHDKMAYIGDFTLNQEKDILMILPRRTILKGVNLPENWHVKEEEILSLYQEENCLAQAFCTLAFDFEGIERSILVFEPLLEEKKLKAFEILASRLALLFDQTPGRYPLYIKLKENDLSLIAKASQMGFIPYFGAWKQSSSQESEELWNQITKALRQTYPQGLQEK